MDTSRTIRILAVVLLTPAALTAQSGGRQAEIPVTHRPPPGMCRIWVDGVPPAKQPAPTACATALRNKPANGRVIFGEPKAATAGRGTITVPPLGLMRGTVVLPGNARRRPLGVDSLRRDRDSTRDATRGTVRDTTRDTTKVRRDTTHRGPSGTS